MDQEQVAKLKEIADQNPKLKRAIILMGELTTRIGQALGPVMQKFCAEHPDLPADLVVGGVAAFIGGMVHKAGGDLEQAKAALEGGYLAAKAGH